MKKLNTIVCRRYVLIIVASFLFVLTLFCQDPVPFQPGSWIKANNVVPPSPQAASLGSYGNVPVNYYTGSPSINIPLYGIGGKYLSAPVSLSYDPQSVRVATIPSWTGLGWTLQAGGVITRSVKGRPDLGDNFFNFEAAYPQFAGMDVQGSSNLILENQFYYAVAGGAIETQPDVYYFNFPGYSGSFVILKNKTIVMRDYSELVINPIFGLDDDITGFTVIDPMGRIYQFMDAERSQFRVGDEMIDPPAPAQYPTYTYHSSWYLTSINSADGSENLTFVNEKVSTLNGEAFYLAPVNPFHNDSYTIQNPDGGSDTEFCGNPQGAVSQGDDLAYEVKIFDRRYLKTITFSISGNEAEKVEFSATAITESAGNPKSSGFRLDRIDIRRRKTGPSAKVLEFQLGYDWSNTSRLMLKTVQENGYNGSGAVISKPPYSFTNFSGSLPPVTSNQIDYWGFYNGADNATLVPYVNIGGGIIINPNGANRRAAFDPRAVLQSIQYPLGGKTEFEYEGHQVPATGEVNVGSSIGGFRVRKITDKMENGAVASTRTFRYALDDATGTSSGKLLEFGDYFTETTFCHYGVPTLEDPQATATYPCNSFTVFASAQSALGSIQGSHIGYARVEEVIGGDADHIGRQVYYFENNLSGGALWETRNGTLLLAETYDKQSRMVKKTFNQYSYQEGPNCPGGCAGGSGLEVRSATSCDINNDTGGENSNNIQLCKTNSGFYEWRRLGFSYTEGCAEQQLFRAHFSRQGYLIKEIWQKLDWTETWDYFYDSGAQQQVYKKTNFEYTDPESGQPTAVYFTNSDGRVYRTEVEYYKSGNIKTIPKKVTKKTGSSIVGGTNQDLDPFGRTLKIYEILDGGSQLQRGVITGYSQGRPIDYKFMDHQTDQFLWENGLMTRHTKGGWVRTYNYHENRQLQSVTEIDGLKTDFDYDKLLRLKEVKARSNHIVTTYTYLLGGLNQVQEQTVYSDAPTQTLVREFDGLGRPTKEIHNGELKHQYFYDAFGRMDKETYLPGNFTEYLFDDSPLNRVIRQVFPDYSQTQTLYLAEGNHYRVTTRDEKGNPTTVDTDLLGRQTKIIDALGGNTVFVYDDAGNIKEVTSPAGQKYNYEYDQRHRLIFKKMPGEDKGRVMGYYDNDDLLKFVVDGNGARIDYEYDGFKRATFTYLNTGINWTKGQTGTYGTKGSLITSNTYHPDAGGAITVNKLKESLVKMADLNGQITTWFDEYDAFGRLTKQREVYPLLQKASNTDQIEFTYNHADWLLREKRLHGGYTPLTTYRDHSYDQFGRMTFDGLFPDFSFETGLVYNMTYNDRDQVTTKKLGGITNPLDKVRFSYTERGWLSQMNDIVYQEVMADLCAAPPPSKPKQVEQEVDLEDLLDLIVSDPNLVIEGADPCVVSDCFERRASYRITVQNPVSADATKYVNVDACIEGLSGQTGLIPLPNYPYCLFAQNEVSQFITDLKAWMGTNGYIYDEITSSYNSATKTYTIDIVSTTYDFTGVEVESIRDYFFVIPQPDPNLLAESHVIDIQYDGGQSVPIDPYYCWGTGGQMATELKAWLQGPGGYTVSNVTYVSAGRDIGKVSILGTNFPLQWVVTCIACGDYTPGDCPKNPKGFLFTSLVSSWGYVEKRSQEIRQCKFPPGTNPGTDAQQPGSIDDLDDIIDTSTPATIPLPNILYKVQLLDGSIRWVFKTELGTIKGKYTRLTEIPILSASQVFTIKKTNGQTIQTDLAGLLNERKTGTIDDIPVPPTTPPPGTDPCTPLSPLGCTDQEQQAQNQSLGQILNDMANLDVSTLQYPVQIHLVRLCDGSTVYILGPFLGDLEGSHLVVSTITVTSASQTFNVTAIQPEPIFAMAFNHEANGNISQAEYQTTYHRSQFYNYTYDALNRLSSGIYGEVVPTYNFVDGNFLKFAYQVNNNYNESNLTYDADGNIKTLQRMGPSDPANCASKVQIDNLLYTYISGTPKLQKVTDSAPSANRAKGFNPGTASGSAVYVYDKNGNLTTDPYKGITIQYNFLNLPGLVTKGGASIVMRYDASGRKWSQTGTEGIREYVGGIEYVDQKIQSVQHGEGRLVATYNAGGTAIESIRAEYWRQDHLGNTRVAFSDFNQDGVIAIKDDPGTTENDVEITQENHYYPFGLNHEGPWYQTVQPKNKYTYNGKEYVEDLGLNWLDYGARWYDPAVGRWFSVDPMAGDYAGWSPYNYVLGNPVRLIDPKGLAATPPNDYFDKNGNYIDSDNKGNNIRIVTDPENFDIKSNKALDSSIEIDGIALSEEAIGKIGGHYLGKLGRSDLSIRGLSQAAFPFMAVTQGDGSPETTEGGYMYFKNPIISISLGGYGVDEGFGRISPNLRDVNDFTNALYHENLHFNAFENLGNGLYRDVVPTGDNWELGHVQMHNMQMTHSSWQGTTDVFKRNHDIFTNKSLNKIKDPKIFEFAKFSIEWVKKAIK